MVRFFFFCLCECHSKVGSTSGILPSTPFLAASLRRLFTLHSNDQCSIPLALLTPESRPPPLRLCRFHVDDLSSAHVYIRMPDGYSMSMIPDEVLHDCAQLVKANSIEGSKKSSVRVVYTPWTNLHKRGGMDVGQVGFHDTKLCKYINIDKKSNEIVNRLNKTKIEKDSSTIRETREEFDRRQRAAAKKLKKELSDQQESAKAAAKKKADEESYGDLFSSGTKQSNKDMDVTAEEYEQDFM